MKCFNNLKLIIMFLLLMAGINLTAQPGGAHMDSLELVSVSGTVIVDTSNAHPHFFLDTDDNGTADYRLNFGPFWYIPVSPDAQLPEDGDPIDIEGGLHTLTSDSMDVIIVFDINGEIWRDPYNPYWNNFRRIQNRYRHAYRNHEGFAFGSVKDSIELVEVSGIFLVDTTLRHPHYALDENHDSIPDYRLNFGPPWYILNNEVDLPDSGDVVVIKGAQVDDKIIVFEINGEVWIDTTGIYPEFGGKWVTTNMTRERFVHLPFDTLTGLAIRTGWNGPGGEAASRMPDSMFCRMVRLYPENIPYTHRNRIIAAYEIGMFNRQNRNMLMHEDTVGAMLKLSAQVRFTFRIPDDAEQAMKKASGMPGLYQWNNETSDWEEVTNSVLDITGKSISYESGTLPGLIIMTAGESTIIDEGTDTELPVTLHLEQNYPNPFNPVTSIGFTLAEDSHIRISVYDVLGRKVTDLAEGYLKRGNHRIRFDARALTSGVYFYVLKTENSTLVRKMHLVK